MRESLDLARTSLSLVLVQLAPVRILSRSYYKGAPFFEPCKQHKTFQYHSPLRWLLFTRRCGSGIEGSISRSLPSLTFFRIVPDAASAVGPTLLYMCCLYMLHVLMSGPERFSNQQTPDLDTSHIQISHRTINPPFVNHHSRRLTSRIRFCQECCERENR